MVKVREDLTGRKFGRLLVINQTEDRVVKTSDNSIRLVARWNCVCECGKYITVDGNSLRSGHTVSCGCYNIEKSIEANKRYNTYVVNNDIVTVFIRNSSDSFIIDKSDLDLIKDICWYKKPNGYIVGTINRYNRVYLHRYITNVSEDLVVDHINGDPTDNRRSNLRICTTQQNSFNKSHLTDSSSGFRGVSFSKNIHKWKAYIHIDDKNICLGYFEYIQNAIIARLQAEKSLFGEFQRIEPVCLFPLVPSAERDVFEKYKY